MTGEPAREYSEKESPAAIFGDNQLQRKETICIYIYTYIYTYIYGQINSKVPDSNKSCSKN